jgi:hypothetical protein
VNQSVLYKIVKPAASYQYEVLSVYFFSMQVGRVIVCGHHLSAWYPTLETELHRLVRRYILRLEFPTSKERSLGANVEKRKNIEQGWIACQQAVV